MKKTIAPLPFPLNIQITPRLLAAVEASAGRKMPPGATLVMMPPVPKDSTASPLNASVMARPDG